MGCRDGEFLYVEKDGVVVDYQRDETGGIMFAASKVSTWSIGW